MFIILGATGHIGSKLCDILLEEKQAVCVVTRSEDARTAWERKGAQVAVLDVRDVTALRELFRRGKRAFLLNPPADPASDTALEERKTARAIADALEGSGLEKVVAESTYCAQPGEAIGDLGVLYEFERSLERQRIPVAIIRGAYYMSNWDMALDTARDHGRVDSLLPANLEMPMVAPQDIAQLAARLLREPATRTGLHFAEGPARYRPADVAEAFAKALRRPVEVASAPAEQWCELLEQGGFSPAAARSMAAMTRIVAEGRCEQPDAPVRGSTTLQQYISALVQNSEK